MGSEMCIRDSYRSPINFSRDLIIAAKNSLDRMYTARNNAIFMLESAPEREMNEVEAAFVERAKQAIDRFDDAMCDDLNTADALGVIFEYVRDMNTQFTDANAPCKAVLEEGLKYLGIMTDVLGLLSKPFDTTPEDIRTLVEARVQAKKAKNFAEADRLRDEVLARGYIIEDTPKGPKVKKA